MTTHKFLDKVQGKAFQLVIQTLISFKGRKIPYSNHLEEQKLDDLISELKRQWVIFDDYLDTDEQLRTMSLADREKTSKEHIDNNLK